MIDHVVVVSFAVGEALQAVVNIPGTYKICQAESRAELTRAHARRARPRGEAGATQWYHRCYHRCCCSTARQCDRGPQHVLHGAFATACFVPSVHLRVRSTTLVQRHRHMAASAATAFAAAVGFQLIRARLGPTQNAPMRSWDPSLGCDCTHVDWNLVTQRNPHQSECQPCVWHYLRLPPLAAAACLRCR